ncbi:MAG: hypothetical protein BroJett013_07450 [Alphaproteobacteria bacterium]|nr:MAG: hypothetical protein BroJett013_07450 [Alphaproteobacteria bacterium]
MQIILVLIALIVLGLGVTWYCADDQPVLGPARPGRVTFKQVVQNFFRDVADLCAPLFTRLLSAWRWASPKVLNPTTWAALAVNAALYAPLVTNDPTVAPLIQALLAKYPLIGLAAALIGLWATRQVGAPRQIPPLSPHAGGGLVSQAALQ